MHITRFRLSRPPVRTLHLVLGALALGSAASAGTVRRVGPGQTHSTIQDAIANAASGDLILVTPGTFAPFVVDGKGISVVGDGGPIVITQTPNTPEVTVRNIPLGQDVTIMSVHIDYLDEGAPAVHVHDNPGSVRFSKLKITPTGDMIFGTTAQAMVEVERTATFWLIDSSIWWTGTEPLTGNPLEFFAKTLNPRTAGGISNDGVSAVQLLDSHGVVQNSKLRGFSGFTSLTSHAGDGLRVVDLDPDVPDASAWLLEDVVGPDFQATFKGGKARFGGHAVHQMRDPFERDLIQACGGEDAAVTHSYEPGAQSATPGSIGGLYGENNYHGGHQSFDPITGQPTGNFAFAPPEHCLNAQRNESSVSSVRVPINSSFDVRVRSRLARKYLVFYSTSSAYVFDPVGITGRGVADGNTIMGTSPGTTSAMTTSLVSVSIPNDPNLIGLQISVQSLFGPVAGAFNNVGLPSLAVMTP